ncbi:CHAP domain-containing protein [Pseudomonas benzenivorans]|uniref:CHAP domain-containing protein n=1 Tax=Pseudomonas benzenivorans TaxID=556533 RepID=A0ABZ0PWZ7_9PSED|nr:CHAP domain-containing protein [Pseudomonas benzenivorans]WPC05451.1 CHAP domain-containing protein [Pseudomonas benzenivorans]
MSKRRLVLAACALLVPLLALALHAGATRINPNARYEVGERLDELNGVAIYFNGGVNTTVGRNLTRDGYNLGLRFQCVEFVKRYYFERFAHRMPDSYGHAKDFFDPRLADGAWNAKRGLLQFSNGSAGKPRADDLLVFSPWLFNRYGHVAIIASVSEDSLEIAQQNPGPFGSARETLPVAYRQGRWFIDQPRVLGWLRLPADGEAPSP